MNDALPGDGIRSHALNHHNAISLAATEYVVSKVLLSASESLWHRRVGFSTDWGWLELANSAKGSNHSLIVEYVHA